jgi:hypothetical protein
VAKLVLDTQKVFTGNMNSREFTRACLFTCRLFQVAIERAHHTASGARTVHSKLTGKDVE